MIYPSFNVFKGCMEAIFAIEPYVNGHSVPTLGDNITGGLIRMLVEEFNDIKPAWLDWWLYETNRGGLTKGRRKHSIRPDITMNGKKIEIRTLEALYKLLTGGFDE